MGNRALYIFMPEVHPDKKCIVNPQFTFLIIFVDCIAAQYETQCLHIGVPAILRRLFHRRWAGSIECLPGRTRLISLPSKTFFAAFSE
jgi:hypothetical protein